jgi:hypothetical protein
MQLVWLYPISLFYFLADEPFRKNLSGHPIFNPNHWVHLTKDFESPFKSLVGSAYRIKQACQQMGKCWVHGIRRCSEVFPDT